MYWFKIKYRQIKNILKWIPRLWNQYNFDYGYAIDIFKYKLSDIADFLESDRTKCVGAKERAQRIRMIIRLMEKVYNEEYNTEYQEKLESIYGKDNFKIIFTEIKEGKHTGSYSMNYQYELNQSKELIKEIENTKDFLFKLSKEKQQRAHELLWKLIEHNIRDFWD